MTMPEILRRKLMERIDIASEPDDGEVLEEIDRLILGEEETRYLPVAQKAELRRQLFYSVRRLDVLQELLEDAGITEIMVNGYQHIFVERNGRIERYGKSFTSAEKLEDVIQQIVGRCNRVVNEQNPIVDARLENGDRVNVVMKPVALNGPILTIRRFPEQAVTMEFLVSIGSITKEAAEFLQVLVRTRYSMMIGGATGSGKTTFLNALSAYIPKGERIITIEDNAELQIQGVENLVRLEAKEANLESGTEITIRDLIRAALRMRPNRVIIGEVRGAETFELLSALICTMLSSEYILWKFPCFTSKEKKEGLQCQVEYVLCGKNSDQDNLAGTVNRLLALREAANLVYLAKDAQKQGEMEAMAGVIAASFGVPAAMPVVKMALAVCWAFAESILDLRELLDGGKVALFKTAESWQLSLEQLPKLLETGDQSRKNAPGGMEYSDYLRLLLMQKSGKAVTFGAMDLVEYNMRTEQQQPGFRLDCCVDELEAGFTAVIGKREYEITRNYGYEMQGAA